MSVSSALATAASKGKSMEARIDGLVLAVGTMHTALSPLISAGSSQGTFLAGLSLLPHQTTSNAQDTNTGPYWVTGERSFQADLAQAVNNLQTNLQANGYQA